MYYDPSQSFTRPTVISSLQLGVCTKLYVISVFRNYEVYTKLLLLVVYHSRERKILHCEMKVSPGGGTQKLDYTTTKQDV